MDISHKFKKLLYYKLFKPLGYNPFDYRYVVSASMQKAFRENGLNLCFNNQIRKQYKKGMKNILVAIESPEVIEREQWIDSEMEFYAEVSFQKFSAAPHWYCCRELYATLDTFVDLPAPGVELPKTKPVSFVYSHQQNLSGHRFRHQLAAQLPHWVGCYGSGTGKFLDQKAESLREYFFQVVVENGKYPEYVSEKFFDCVKLKTVPLYWGGTLALKKMGFDAEGYIPFETAAELLKLLETLNLEQEYHRRMPALEYNLNRLREIRNETKWQLYLAPLQLHYMGTSNSRMVLSAPKLNLLLE